MKKPLQLSEQELYDLDDDLVYKLARSLWSLEDFLDWAWCVRQMEFDLGKKERK